ncbi:MAG TPA: PQQ-binding-like beta-propeller repeat protein [Tepidisphaeraceae bacterium]|jgi:outer membrane protein assembly factor BamB|nr:PQQ-binding-like beta-propeller repeat protein [Tepidisphaeraceae bacterium]
MKSNTLRRIGQSLFVFGASLVLAGAVPARGGEGDWPQWRGPKRDDISTETGLLKDWPSEGPALAWTGKGVGEGFSSVSIAGGKIFTMGDLKDGSSVIALDMAGKKLWSTKVGQPGGGGGYPGTRCTPTVDADRLYAIGQYGDLVCLQTEDGKEVWRTNLESDLGGEMMSGWGYSESPLVDGNMLLCCPGGKRGTVAALDKKTGKVLWRSTKLQDRAAYSSLVPADIGGVHQFIVFTDASVSGIGVDGAVLWTAARKGKTAVIPTPVVKDDLVFVTSEYGVGCNCFKITRDGNAFKAEQLYAKKDMEVKHGGIILLDGYVYGSSGGAGILSCVELASGNLKWKDRSVGKGALAYADGRLYLRAEGSGEVALVEATPDGYKEHGRLKQPDRSRKEAWAHPVIAGGKLYLRDQDNLFCYDIKAK